MITSLLPRLALRTPAIAPHSAPAAVPTSSGNRNASGPGSFAAPHDSDAAVAKIPPTQICPSPPTLVRLARSAST